LRNDHNGQPPSEEQHDSAVRYRQNRLTVGRTLQPRQFVAGRSYKCKYIMWVEQRTCNARHNKKLGYRWQTARRV